MKSILALILITLLAGCSQIKERLMIKPKIVERPALVLQETRPVQSKNVEFVIITKENVDEVFSNLEKSGQDMVFFALTDNGYKALSLSVADMRRYIVQQNAVIKAYKDYYQPKKEEAKK